MLFFYYISFFPHLCHFLAGMVLHKELPSSQSAVLNPPETVDVLHPI